MRIRVTMCGDRNQFFTCTLDLGHEGYHIAEGQDHRPVRVWRDGEAIYRLVKA